MLIGVFDSGIGGEAIARKLRELIPGADVISVNDHEHVPYGTKSLNEIIGLTDAAIQPLLDQNCDVIIIACNTATTIAISYLRQTYPNKKFVGIEPMIKPAANLTHIGVIAVFATPQTLKSARYSELKNTWAKNITIIEPDCSTWASRIEKHASDEIDVRGAVESIIQQGADVVVLGCTHYHWIKQRFLDAIGDRAVIVLEPTDAIAHRVQEIMY
jgi:glutamate racemase